MYWSRLSMPVPVSTDLEPKPVSSRLPSWASLCQQQPSLRGSRSNVARHDLGCVGIVSGILFAGHFTVSRLPSSAIKP